MFRSCLLKSSTRKRTSLASYSNFGKLWGHVADPKSLVLLKMGSSSQARMDDMLACPKCCPEHVLILPARTACRLCVLRSSSQVVWDSPAGTRQSVLSSLGLGRQGSLQAQSWLCCVEGSDTGASDVGSLSPFWLGWSVFPEC